MDLDHLRKRRQKIMAELSRPHETITLKIKDEATPVLKRISSRLEAVEELLQKNSEDMAELVDHVLTVDGAELIS